jgi:hypothetical protein
MIDESNSLIDLLTFKFRNNSNVEIILIDMLAIATTRVTLYLVY